MARVSRPDIVVIWCRLLAAAAIAIVLALNPARAAPSAVEITSDASIIALREQVRALFESDHPLDPETVARLSDSGKPHPLSPPNYGRYDKPVWGYVAVVNRLPRREWMLVYSLSTVEDVRVFIRRRGEVSFHRLDELAVNAKWPFTGFRSATYVLSLDTDVPVEIVTRLATRAPIGFHLQLWTPEALIKTHTELIGAAGVSVGVPVAVLVYLLILAAVVRHRGLVSLMVLIASKLVLDAWISGLNLLVLPAVPRTVWPTVGFATLGIFALACVLHFRRFLDLPRTSRWADRVVLAIGAFNVALATTEIFHLANIRFLAQLGAPIAFICFVAMAAGRTWRSPNSGNIAYTLAWAMFFSEAVIEFLRLIVRVPFAEDSLIFGQSAIASLLFGVAIFTRVRDKDHELNRSLSETNERFRLAIDGSAAAIYEYSFRDGGFSFAPRLSKMIPVEAGAGLSAVLRSLALGARRELLHSINDAVSQKARDFRIEISPDDLDRELRVLAVTGAIQYSKSGAPERICGSVIDVTSEANLRIEQTLRTLVLDEKERAERSLRARTEFYAAANHDLRHPLLSLGLYLEMLTKTPARLQAFLPRMLDAHRSASLYLDRIVAMARTDASSEFGDRHEERLHQVLSRLVDRYQADAQRKKLALRYVPSNLSVVTNTFLLERILSNVISNAIQHTERGGVLVGCRRHQNGVRIDVIDTGPGLPSAVRDQLTGEGGLRQSDIPGSLRLGLSIVKRTTDELGCLLDVESYPGRGTRISVLFAQIADAASGRSMQVA